MTDHLTDDCLFCKIIRGEVPSIKLYEDDDCYCFMDIMPQSDGHCLVIPKYHSKDFFDLPIDQAQKCLAVAQKLGDAVDQGLNADGIRIMQFNRAPAGQSVFHYHIHIIPAYEGRDMGLHARNMASPEDLQPFADKIIAALT